MEIEVSQKTARLSKSLGLKPQEMAFADLVSCGWDPTDAYFVAFHQGSTWARKTLKDEVEKLQSNENVKSRIDETRNVLSKRQKDAIVNKKDKEVNMVVSTAMSKEQMLYELQTAKKNMVAGSKDWLDINKLIVDVTRMKQDEVQTENNTIHHYLPVRYPTGCQDCLYSKCDQCKYKKAYKEED